MNPLIQFKQTTVVFLVAFGLACFALSPKAQAVLPAPTPDGAYPGHNTAEGLGALFNVTNGGFNTAIGEHALFEDTAGTANTAVGAFTLAVDTTGSQNVAVGQGALGHTTGDANVGVGFKALFKNAALNGNTAVGGFALFNAATSPENVAVGFNALQATSGSNGFNVAVGFRALDNVTTGGQNTAVGDNALGGLVTGTENTALGDLAGLDHSGSDSGNVDIGAFEFGVPGESNITRIKNITSTAFTTGGFFLYEVNGAIGIFTSSRKFKDDIKPIDKASETIYSLNPVTFRAKPQSDPSRPRGYGLIAEDVEKVNPDLVSHGEKDILTVRYESINAMLLNEFLKEHKKIGEQQASIAELKKEVGTLTATVKEQATQIQRVSAQLEASKPAPQVVNNP